MAKVLLVNPPFYRLLESHYNANSLGIAYVASYLNSHGHDAWVYNADFLNRKSFLNQKNLFKGFDNYKKFFQDEENELWKEVVEKIIEFEPEWVGYTSYTANVTAIDIISRKLRMQKPKIKQVIGGVHATLDPDILKKLKNIDFSIQREGEHAMFELVEGSDPKNISGVVSRGPEGLIYNFDADVIRNIDGLPFPEREKFWGLTEEEKLTVDVSYICSIRGCPYRCNYCASPAHWKRDKTQYRSPSSLVSEMRYVKEKYWNRKRDYDYSASANAKSKNELIIEDNSAVYFVDDIFTVHPQRIKEILRMMIDQKLGMKWKCEARTDHLDEEICQLMAKAGCIRVKLGFESGSDRILKMIEKDETTKEMRRGAKLLKNAGVPFTGYFMVGFPGETDDDVRETIKFAKEIEADYYSLSILAPYYGTKMYYDMIDQGHELDKKPWEYFFHQTGDLMVNNKISPEILKEYLNLSELNNNRKGYV